jgi:hypothetical protein
MFTPPVGRLQDAPPGLTDAQFISWYPVPLSTGKTDKIPCDKYGNACDAHDPAIWTTPDDVIMRPHRTGFVLTRAARRVCVDLDRCWDATTGAWKPIVAEVMAWVPDAYIEVSHSGTGLHFIFTATLPDGHRCKSALGVEMYSDRRFIALTGTHARGRADVDYTAVMPAFMERFGLNPEPLPALPEEGRSLAWKGPEDDDALLALMLTQVPRAGVQMFGDGVTAAQVWNMDVPALARAWPAEGRSDGLAFDHSSADMSLISHLSYFTGRDLPRMQRLFERWPGYREWKYQRARGYHMSRVLARGSTNKRVLGDHTTALVGREAAEGQPAQPGQFYAYLPKTTFYHRPTKAFWPAATIDNIIPVIDVGDAKIKASRWLSRHQPIHQIAWWPGAGEVIEGWTVVDGVWREDAGNRVLNTYEPAPPPQCRGDGDVGRWLGHIRAVYPQHYDVVLDWMAFVAQNPTVKVNWCLVFGGAQGIGKDSMLAPLNRAVGEQNWQSVSPEQIMDEVYNDYLECRVLIINEAKDTGDGTRFQFYDKTKTIITSPPKFHSIRSMYAGRRKSSNLNATIITTNYRTGGLYLPADDRRHYVMFSDVMRDAFNETYWNSYHTWMEGGGVEHCMAFLLARDVSRFNPKAPPLQTPEFWEMVGGGQTNETNDVADAIEFIKNKTFSIDDLAAVAMFEMRNHALADWFRNKANGTKINRVLNDMGIIKYRNPEAPKDGRWRINSVKVTLYHKP